jgi:tryptophan synthase alpha chain
MTRRIGEMFRELKSRGKKAFIPFIMAGDPDLETTIRLVPELERAGSHIIELGIPFSDPVADGPTIQRAAERALRHRYGLSDYLAAVKTIRRASQAPLMIFSYYNPIFQYGLELFAHDARAAGVDGILITDITPEEGEDYCSAMEANNLDAIFLAAPTSNEERIGRIAACSRGFIYVVSRAGVTGAQQQLSDTVLPTIQRVRQRTSLPVVVGFGISNPEQVRAIWELSDGAVVGSAIVAEMERIADPQALPLQVGEYCRWLTGSAGKN